MGAKFNLKYLVLSLGTDGLKTNSSWKAPWRGRESCYENVNPTTVVTRKIPDSRHLDVQFSVFEEGSLNQRVLSVWRPRTYGVLSWTPSSVSISDVSISVTLNKA